MANKGIVNSSKLNGWGNSMLNKLPSISRNRRKRLKSKIRRNKLKKEINNESF